MFGKLRNSSRFMLTSAACAVCVMAAVVGAAAGYMPAVPVGLICMTLIVGVYCACRSLTDCAELDTRQTAIQVVVTDQDLAAEIAKGDDNGER